MYIVARKVGKNVKPSITPVVHNTYEDAVKEAERMCAQHKEEFVVFRATAISKPEVTVKTSVVPYYSKDFPSVYNPRFAPKHVSKGYFHPEDYDHAVDAYDDGA